MTGTIHRLQRTALRVIILSVLLFGFAAGCDKDDNNSGGGNPGSNEVWIQGNAFVPSNRTVSAGTTVTWTNKEGTVHTVTGTGFDSGNLANNATFSFTFPVAGTFPYHCTIHPTMAGTITVQ